MVQSYWLENAWQNQNEFFKRIAHNKKAPLANAFGAFLLPLFFEQTAKMRYRQTIF